MKFNLTALLQTAPLLRLPAWAGIQQPNIVHIVADDLGWKDVGFNGCTDIKTPHLDKLAAEGAKLTQFYVQPMCTPTRAALQFKVVMKNMNGEPVLPTDETFTGGD
jgi:hypothetical protein